MGLSSLPTPSAGMLTVIIVNTVMSIAILKQTFNSVLGFIGFSPLSPPEPESGPERCRYRLKPVRFGRRRHVSVDCRVCLGRFEPESVVSRLPCGHVFHKGCVEAWMDYKHDTCPLCRAQLVHEEEGVGF